MRKFLSLPILFGLAGCAVPVGNLTALQGEGLQLGGRFTASGPIPSESEVDPALPAGGTVFASLVKPWWYARAEAGLFPVASLGTGGSTALGVHWKDRAALGGHMVVNEGTGWGLDLSVRPLEGRSWVAGVSWTPQQFYPQDTAWDRIPRPRVGAGRDLEWSLGWSPAPADHPDGVLSVESTLRHGSSGWVAGLRLTAAARLLAPAGR